MKREMRKKDYLTVKEVVEYLYTKSDENKPVRFHSSRDHDMCLLSVYPSDDGKFIEVDVGYGGE